MNKTKLFGDNKHFNKYISSINIWDDKFSDYLNDYNANFCNIIKLDINFEGVKQNDTVCQNNVLLLGLLKINATISISTFYGLGEIILNNLKNIKCKINLHNIDIIIDDFNDNYKYTNITLYPMIDNNYYTNEKIKTYCLTNHIKVVEQDHNKI